MIDRRSFIAAAIAAGTGAARAEAVWPNRPVTLVLGFAAGGPNDLIARLLAQQLAATFKQSVVVDNRPGANGNIAAGVVAHGRPDGYTFLYNSSSLALSPALYAGMTLKPLRDLVPVNGTAALPLVCVAAPNFPASNYQEWVATIRANPDKYSFGSPGLGNLAHVVPEMLLHANGLKALHVPYKGSSEALQGLLAGSTQFQFDAANSPMSMIRAGLVKPLFVTSARRSPALPNVPTLSESGGKTLDLSAWQGVMAPAGTPDDIVNRMAAAISATMNRDEMKQALAAQGAYPIASDAHAYAVFFGEQMALYKKTIDELGIKLDG